jgi:hypothetical protein
MALRAFAFLSCCLLSVGSFAATRVFLRPGWTATQTPADTVSGGLRAVELPYASALDVLALTDNQLLEARGLLSRTLKTQLIKSPTCFDSLQDSAQGDVKATYKLAAREGMVHASLIDRPQFLPRGRSPIKDSVKSCLLSRIEGRFSVKPPHGLAREGDLGEKIFSIPVGAKGGACGG